MDREGGRRTYLRTEVLESARQVNRVLYDWSNHLNIEGQVAHKYRLGAIIVHAAVLSIGAALCRCTVHAHVMVSQLQKPQIDYSCLVIMLC